MRTTRHMLALLGGIALALPGPSTASAQGVRFWNRPPARLSGTFELDQSQSDDLLRTVRRATQSLPSDQRDRVSQRWMSRLESPQTIAIDVNGPQVMIASSSAPRIEFDADGRTREEQGPDGRMMSTRAGLNRGALTVSTSGNRGSDFTVTFEPAQGGLRVTRRLDSEMTQASVVVHSFYRRVAAPRWDVYADRAPDRAPDRGPDRGPPDRGTIDRGRDMPVAPPMMLIPAGTQLTTQLDRPITPRTMRQGERFTVTVAGRGPYGGAVIDGVVALTDGRNGRAQMSFDFDRITMRDGRTGRFEAMIDEIRMPDGSMIRVERSGAVEDRGRPGNNAVQGGAIGAALGAIIGAVAGGTKGAVIGAVAGGVVGASGMIVLDSGDDRGIPGGAQLTITSVGWRQ